MPSDAKVYLPNSRNCFVCGEENPAGLRTRFYVEGGTVRTRLHVRAHHCGYANTVHGGVVAAALDEAMGWAAARALERMCLPAELTVRYLKPVPAGRDLMVTTEVLRVAKRLTHVAAAIVDDTGTLYVKAEGRFVPLSVEQTLNIDSRLLYRGGEERVFDRLRAQRDATSPSE